MAPATPARRRPGKVRRLNTTTKSRRRTTPSAGPALAVPETTAEMRSQAEEPMSPSNLASSTTPRVWQAIGFCFYCRERVEALQPGGIDARHIDDGVPYEQCEKALRYKSQSK